MGQKEWDVASREEPRAAARDRNHSADAGEDPQKERARLESAADPQRLEGLRVKTLQRLEAAQQNNEARAAEDLEKRAAGAEPRSSTRSEQLLPGGQLCTSGFRALQHRADERTVGAGRVAGTGLLERQQ